MSEPNVNTIVKDAHERWNAAFNNGDAAAVAALYAEDGTVLPHTHTVVRGREAITEFWFSLKSVKGSAFLRLSKSLQHNPIFPPEP